MNATARNGIVNIINFIRGVEPRPGKKVDLVEPVECQMELAKKHKLPVTWLVQYDAMLDRRFLEVLNNMGPEDEIGIWLEFVQPLVEKAGLKWRGDFAWDWHADVGFSVGYAVEERLRMIDIFVEDFRATFGYAPKVAGSWFIDANSLAHLELVHQMVAFCNCKDQWGTDGYTLWGGYFNQAYYPSRKNSYIPAQSREFQIGIPTFRMLGSDPIHQYEAALLPHGKSVVTLEPVYPRAGGDPKWVDRFLKNIFETPSLSFGYTQVGQENSFGWPAMEKGLVYQHQCLADMRDCGLIRVETLSKSGEWFKATYPLTPPSAVVAERDVEAEDRGALWYCSKDYRASIEWDGADLRIRDVQVFDQRREEPFLTAVCPSHDCKYDALPVVDGCLWSSVATKAGLYIKDAQTGLPYRLQAPPKVCERDVKTLTVDVDGSFSFVFEESSFELHGDAQRNWVLEAVWDDTSKRAFLGSDDRKLSFRHDGFDYGIDLLRGTVKDSHAGFVLYPDGKGVLKLRVSRE